MPNLPEASNLPEAKRIIEGALLSSQEPLSLADLKRLFEDEIGADTLRRLLDELREDWAGRAVELVEPGKRLALPDPARFPAVRRPDQSGKARRAIRAR